jgi:hypothetical protein
MARHSTLQEHGMVSHASGNLRFTTSFRLRSDITNSMECDGASAGFRLLEQEHHGNAKQA